MKKIPPQTFSTFSRITCVIVLLFATILPALIPTNASAAQITTRSLTLQANGANGGSAPGVASNHYFQFTQPGGSTIGSIQFEYCTTAANSVATPACVAPTGLDLTSSTLGAETGVTGFTKNNIAVNSVYLGRAPAAIGTNVATTYRLDGVINPTAVNGETFFVRITTYATNNATGGSTDAGNVAAATNRPIVITGTMPESLVFCTGESIGLNVGVPDCSTVTTGSITFDQLFSPVDTSSTQSQMAASTNAGAGYSITVNGSTLTSGANTISAMNTAAVGVRGTSQFGLNLKLNTVTTTTVARGIEVAPAANGTNYKGQAFTGYEVADTFKFTSGDPVAKSDNGGAGGTDAQIFTVSYIANVPGSQPAGTYTSTLTYICTPTF